MRNVLIVGIDGYVGTALVTAFSDSEHRIAGVGLGSDAKPTLPMSITCDISDVDKTATVVTKLCESMCLVDVLVLNAGLMAPEDGALSTLDISTLRATMEVNVVGVLNAVKTALPYMERASAPVIVFVNSVCAVRGSPRPQLAYTASKGALLAVAREMAVSLAPSVRVNTVLPGPLEGGLLARHLDQQGLRDRAIDVPLARLGLDSEVAHAVAFLADSRSSHLTGVELTIDGGASAQYQWTRRELR